MSNFHNSLDEVESNRRLKRRKWSNEESNIDQWEGVDEDEMEEVMNWLEPLTFSNFSSASSSDRNVLNDCNFWRFRCSEWIWFCGWDLMEDWLDITNHNNKQYKIDWIKCNYWMKYKTEHHWCNCDVTYNCCFKRTMLVDSRFNSMI